MFVTVDGDIAMKVLIGAQNYIKSEGREETEVIKNIDYKIFESNILQENIKWIFIQFQKNHYWFFAS